eukprot:3883055-Amphidinium_carterae.2
MLRLAAKCLCFRIGRDRRCTTQHGLRERQRVSAESSLSTVKSSVELCVLTAVAWANASSRSQFRTCWTNRSQRA